MEITIVSQFLYPACNVQLPPSISFGDQFDFCPTGSTAAAIVAILHTVSHVSTINPYAIVILLDFSKTFDTVRHSTDAEDSPAERSKLSTTGWWILFSDHNTITQLHRPIEKEISDS